MAFGGHKLRQVVVEFIRGTGIRTNGVVNTSNTGTVTPFTWIVPHDVTYLIVDGCSGGAGGGAGGGSGAQWQSGGGGGATGMQCFDLTLSVRPLSTLTITIGAGGLGGIAGSDVGFGSNSGDAGITSVSGIQPSATNTGTFFLSPPRTIIAGLGTGNSSTTTSVAGGIGGIPNTGFSAAAAGGGTSAGGGTTGGYSFYPFLGVMSGSHGGGGGGSATLNTSAGGNGGRSHQGNTTVLYGITGKNENLGGTGNVFAFTISRGGGGSGGSGLFGLGGLGGQGGAAGTNGTGYGSGGGGGGGGGDGGNGADGYLRFTYWSFD